MKILLNDINNLKEAFTLNVKYYNDLVEKQRNVLANLKNETISYYNQLSINKNNDSSSQSLNNHLNNFKQLFN